MKNPIICFEGPSGIGKTTMCNLLNRDFFIVPEVNLLFKRSENEPKFWYHERQVERYKMCVESNRASILDGDVFQPIWYNWVCNYPPNFLSKQETHRFYRSQLIEGKIQFPDLYIIFYADESELRIRKENDSTRQRRNFEKHLEIIEPLKEYWRFLKYHTDLELHLVHYTNLTETKDKVLSLIEQWNYKTIDQMNVYHQIIEWIDTKNRIR